MSARTRLRFLLWHARRVLHLDLRPGAGASVALAVVGLSAVLVAFPGEGARGRPTRADAGIQGGGDGGGGAETGGAGPSALEVARSLRLAGREDEALAHYRRAALAPDVRVDHRRRARYEAARMGLERGETSAVVELEGLVREGLAPHELARSAVALRRAADGLEPETSMRARAVARACIEELERLAHVLDMTGVRARNWLQKLDSTAILAVDAVEQRTSVPPFEHARAPRGALRSTH